MGVSRQAYYRGASAMPDASCTCADLVQLVEHELMCQPRVGTRKLHRMLREPLQRAGIQMGCDAMFDVLRNARLLVPNR